jgi:hypothetical protein
VEVVGGNINIYVKKNVSNNLTIERRNNNGKFIMNHPNYTFKFMITKKKTNYKRIIWNMSY